MGIENYGRVRELALLNERYVSSRFEFGYLYGQRRIGKSTLLSMFCQGKKSLIFRATDSSDVDIRKYFSKTLNEARGISAGTYESWPDFFSAIDEYFGDEPGIMCVDEYPNIVVGRDGKRKRTDFASALQNAIDSLFLKRRFVLILTGSNVSFMEKEIGDYGAPLYRRNTFSLRLLKFEFNEALIGVKDVHGDFEKAKILSLTNTFPFYLSLIDQSKGLDENLTHLFYERSSLFVQDPGQLITNDIVRGGYYASIIKAIAEGDDTVAALSERLNLSSGNISKYLEPLLTNHILIKRGFFQKERKCRYEILDPMLAFYYRFIRENAGLIAEGFSPRLKKNDETGIANFVGHAYEKLCLTYLEYLSKNGRLGGLFVDFRNFQFDSKLLGRSVEVDVISADKFHLLLAETKFSTKKRTLRDYYDMLEDLKAEPFRPFKQVELYLFGAAGFGDSLRSLDDPRLHLVDLPTMFAEMPASA